MRTILNRLLMLLALIAAPATAAAPTIDDLARDAEGDTLALVIHGVEGHEATVRAFQRRFPKVNVQVTVQNPSTMGPRIVTEQQNGIYAWDSWWAVTTAMNNIVLPAGGFAPITDYLVLPEVRDPNAWRAPAHRFTSDRGPYIFLQSLNTESGIMFNRSVIKDFELKSAKDLLDPRLKGRIAVRDPSSGTTAGSYVLAQLLKEEGPEFVRKLLLEQEPAIIENGRQVTDAVLRGDYAVSMGSSADILSKCHKMGGCKAVTAMPIATVITSRGVAVLKNPPHPAAARLWVNWLLSREGQEVYVREWAKDQSSGAVSLRRDVAPDPEHVGTVPDYDRLDSYGLYGMDAGRETLAAGNSLFARLEHEMQRRPSRSAQVIALVALGAVLLLVARLIVTRLTGRRKTTRA